MSQFLDDLVANTDIFFGFGKHGDKDRCKYSKKFCGRKSVLAIKKAFYKAEKDKNYEYVVRFYEKDITDTEIGSGHIYHETKNFKDFEKFVRLCVPIQRLKICTLYVRA